MKTVIEISDEAMRMVNRIISNEIPVESCPEKNAKANWKKDQVRQEIIQRLQVNTNSSVGPTQTK